MRQAINRKQGAAGRTGSRLRRYSARVHRESRGFTLIEILIVVAILGALAAVVLPDVTGLAGEGQTEAARAELSTVQTAMDTMMARNSLTAVTATAATADMSSFPAGNALYPGYLDTAVTRGTYSCGSTGLVTQETTGY